MPQELGARLIEALHEIVPSRVYDYGRAAGDYNRDLGTLSELSIRFVAGKERLAAYCQGVAAVTRQFLIGKRILPAEDIRCRVVLIDGYEYHTILEYRDRNVWKVLDPGKYERGFRVSGGITRSWKAREVVEKLDKDAWKKVNDTHQRQRLQKITTRPPETTALNVMFQDIVSAVDGPFQPWEYGYRYFVEGFLITGDTAVELYNRLGRDCERVLRFGDQEEMRKFKAYYGIVLG